MPETTEATADLAPGEVIEVPVVEAAGEDAPTADAGDTAAAETAAAEAPKEKAPRAERTDTKSHQVRLFITAAKQMKDENGEPLAEPEMKKIVVKRAVDDLGMKIALARTYVKNNWSKA